jgi:RimJ/RimL family protein N-acetyltransferase
VVNAPQTPFRSSWPHPQAQEFAGRFITLTPLNIEDDMDALWHVSHNTEEARALWCYLPGGPFAEVAEMRAFFHDWQAKPDVVAFTVREKATHRRVGGISIMSIRPEHGVAELGFIWYAPGAQRTKANTEANCLLLRHCFDDLGYRRMEWKCNAANERSRRAALRLGYRFEGTFRQHMIVKGLNRDTAWFSMLDHEWADNRRAMERWLYEDEARSLASWRETAPNAAT